MPTPGFPLPSRVKVRGKLYKLEALADKMKRKHHVLYDQLDKNSGLIIFTLEARNEVQTLTEKCNDLNLRWEIME